MKILANNSIAVVTLLTIIGAYLRFQTLDWGNGQFLHPDELNIGFAVSAVYAPESMNPQFFAYGSFPIYVTYFAGVLQNIGKDTVDIWRITLDQSLIIGRFLSALVSTALIPLTYLLSRKLHFSRNQSSLATVFTTFSIGFIQFAHFATFEIFLTFFYISVLLASLNALTKPTVKSFVILGTLIGLTIGTKIVSAYLLIAPFAILFLKDLQETPSLPKTLLAQLHPKKLFRPYILASVCIAVFVYVITNPFVLLSHEAFLGSMKYEQGVATGSLPVFYTRNFLDTTPVLYQFTHIFPFISGYLFHLVATIAVFAILIHALKDTRHSKPLLLFFTVFGGYTLFHLSMFVKWTRYMTPVLPLLIISLCALIGFIHKKHARFPVIVLTGILIFEIVFRGLSFSTLYSQIDSRSLAAEWLSTHTTEQDAILSEVFDPNIIPFNEKSGDHITLFNMYELDEVENKHVQLAQMLEGSDYIILPSDRVYASALRMPDRFPIAYSYYKALFSGSLGFDLVYENDPRLCLLAHTALKRLPQNLQSFLCPINKADAEGTFYVFDHPKVQIFKKTSSLSQGMYSQLLLSH